MALLGGVAATWPLRLSAQQLQRLRRIGVLANFSASDAEMQHRIAVFEQELDRLGWKDGRNLRIDYRFFGADQGLMRSYAAELVRLQPDLIVATPAPAVGALRQETQAIPVVIVTSGDPVQAGFVQSLAQPGRNITGFLMFEQTMVTKWLELLREVAPRLSRVAVIQNPDNTAWRGDFPAIASVAPSLGIAPTSLPVHNAADIEREISAFAVNTDAGLLVLPDTTLNVNRDLVVALAAQHSLPAIYPYRYYVAAGGMMSYGVDVADIYRRLAAYVNRILRGDSAGDLPVQAPVKFELVINLTAARKLGITFPRSLLARADEVIE